MAIRRRHKRQEDSMVLPLVALLDVIFFMLLYFMAAGSLLPPEAELPASITAEKRGAGGKGSDFTTQVLRVEVADNAVRFRLGDRVMVQRAELVSALSKLPKEPGIIVKVADEATVSAAATAVQSARDAGFTKVSYVAGL